MLTPIRKQYLEIKRRYLDAILLFRMGDFYEAFDEDAATVARELGITLTSKPMGKNMRVPMAGIPYHSLAHHLSKLIGKGFKVAICEQLTPPGRGLVERDVIRVVTPGTVVEPSLLEGKANNYLASIVSEEDEAAIAYVDITTSEFCATQLAAAQAVAELERLKPSEILVAKSFEPGEQRLPGHVTRLEDKLFDLEACRRALMDHFQVRSLAGFGCEDLPLVIRAAGAIVGYLERTQKGTLAQLVGLKLYSTEAFMKLDAQTLKDLEVFESSLGTNEGSLLTTLDFTRTLMGGRLLRKWLRQPLLDLDELGRRQQIVEWFYKNPVARSRLFALLANVYDIERLINRIKGGLAAPREVVSLGRSLAVIPQIREMFARAKGAIKELASQIKPCEDVASLISEAIVDDPPALDQGGVIKPGYSQDLDQLRQVVKGSKRYLADLEARERQRTGIKSLKVGYNKVFGFYIEVTKPNLSLVPADYVRKQTLVNAERFITLELKEHEAMMANAQERILELENSLFRKICNAIAERRGDVMATAQALAHLDASAALAEAAVRYRYVRPELTREDAILIRGGRHPMVERSLAPGSFVPNDTDLSSYGAQIVILTGPNMSGKSTYLRQVGLIVLLAHVGSFVPAEEAKIGIVDRIFTRVGLQDHLSRGQSSFMLEMLETAKILNSATPRSLVILDEIGRGTSTYDGLAIARAVIEHLHNHPRLRAKTLFATHYYELTELEEMLPRVKNFHVAVSEEDGKVIFLHQVLPGRADKSYGVHVAQLAGLPRPVIKRAEALLAEYQGRNSHHIAEDDRMRRAASAVQTNVSLTGSGAAEAIKELLRLDLEAMSPLEALTKLYELQKKARAT